MFDIRGLFAKEAIIRHLKALPKLKTPVMDTIFTNRPQLGLPVVGADMIKAVIQALPLIRRGAPSIPATRETRSYEFYEPLPIRPSDFISAHELNNLKVLTATSRDAWARTKIEMLRRAIRKTTEAMAAISLTGTITWPVQLENGVMENWEIVFGSVLSEAPGTLWSDSACKVTQVFDLLQAMEEKIQDNGYGGTVAIWAGKTAYSNLLSVVENFKSTAKMRVEMSDQGVNVGGYLVQRRSERNYNPKTKAMVPTVPDDTVKMIALDANMMMPYCALDDLDANLQPMPFFAKPIASKDPSGYKLVAESKPLPIPNPEGICDAVVVS